ncbi:MAG: acyl carrier protein [Desulfobulbus sp.]|jgi:acyl carrier protein
MTEKIIDLILGVNAFAEVTVDTRLIEEGVLDSLGIFLLMESIEKEFIVKIPEDEINPENFLTVNALCDMIRRIHEV